MSNSFLEKDLCFVDIETTGTRFGFHEVIEIGVVRTSPDAEEVRLRWNQRVIPQYPERADPMARKVNGFEEASWGGVPSSPALWKEFAGLVSGAVPVCHNPSFDRPFLTLAASACGVNDFGMDHHWFGTESLALPLVRNGSVAKLSLKSLCEFFDLPPEALPHCALNEAEACAKVYQKCLELYTPVSKPEASKELERPSLLNENCRRLMSTLLKGWENEQQGR